MPLEQPPPSSRSSALTSFATAATLTSSSRAAPEKLPDSRGGHEVMQRERRSIHPVAIAGFNKKSKPVQPEEYFTAGGVA